jgi:hypothetical protein
MRQVGRLVVMIGAAALAACATTAPAPVPTPAPAPAPSVAAVAPAAAPAPADDAAKKVTIPYGYQKVTVDGVDKYCRNDLIPGTRTQHQKVCLTEAQLEADERGAEDFINGVQQHGASSQAAGMASGHP